MLDENLPAFFLKPSTTGVKHHALIQLSHRGSEPEPAYHLQYLDPASPSPAHKNCYAAAIFDAFNSDVLYGEILARPNWSQPTLSQEEIRRNGGIPPPPQAQVPAQFTVQLYNPEQQVTVHLKEGKWGASDSYEFSLPETTFRTPSASSLDRGQSDPGSLDITPRINFAWRKESKLSKDLTCFMTGKSTDKEKKRSKRDPDIAVALWRSMREMTLYESNMSRVDIEDPKGFEVTLLMSAIAIKDLYFSSKERVPELFNITDASGAHKLSSGGRKISNPPQAQVAPAPINTPLPLRQGTPSSNDTKRNSLPKLQTTPPIRQQPAFGSQPPAPPDPRSQWELEAETARLRAAAESEAKEVQRRRREREKSDEAERKRLQKVVEQEQREARRRAEEVEKETQRLRKIYGTEGQTLRPQPNSSQPVTHDRRSFQGTLQSVPQGHPPQPPARPQLGSNGLPYRTHTSNASSSGVFMSGANLSTSTLSVPGTLPGARKKKSFFGLRAASDEAAVQDQRRRLAKKQSTLW